MNERERVQTDEAMGPPETDPRIEGEKHPVAKMIGLGVLASLVGIVISLLIDWFPEPAAASSDDIDLLYDVLLICSVPVFVLVMTIAIYSVVRFRAKPGDMGDGPPIHGNTRLEVFWVTIPFIMVTLLAVYGWWVLEDIEAKQDNELVVNVTGQQFTWTFEYPSEELETRELALPVDRPVEFKIRSNDVIHSFWVPQFRLKSDAVPGLTTSIRLTPNKEGRYQVVCAELCGIGHAAMRQFVRVLPASGFEDWVERQKEASGGGGGGGGEPAEEQGGEEQAAGAPGEQIFTSAGCAGCHALAAAGSEATVGPDLGQLSNAEARFVRESIVNPDAEVAEGFEDDVMPENFGEELSEEELDALVKYLLEAQE